MESASHDFRFVVIEQRDGNCRGATRLHAEGERVREAISLAQSEGRAVFGAKTAQEATAIVTTLGHGSAAIIPYQRL